MAENVMVMARNLEACTGNDALMSESDVRRTSRTLPILLAGSDYVCSGFGIDPALRQHVRPVAVERRGHRRLAGDAARLGRRRRAAHRRRRPRSGGCGGGRPRPAGTSTAGSGWPTSPTSTSSSPSTPSGSKDLRVDPDPMVVLGAAQAIRSSGLGSLEVARALQECGYETEAERVLDMLAAPGARRPPADRRHLRRADAGAEPGHRPQRLRRAGHRLRARRGAAGRDRRRSARPAASRTCARTRRCWRRRLLQGGRAGSPGQRPARGRHRPVPRRRAHGVADAVRAVGRRRAARAARRPRGGGLPGPGRAGQRHPRPRHGRADRGAAGRVRDRDRPAGQGHRADPPPRPAAAGEPRALQHGAGHHPRPLPAAGQQRRPAREGRDARCPPATPTPTRRSRRATTPA